MSRHTQAEQHRLRGAARTCAPMTAEGPVESVTLTKGLTLLAAVEQHLALGELSSERADLMAIFTAFQVNLHILLSMDACRVVDSEHKEHKADTRSRAAHM